MTTKVFKLTLVRHGETGHNSKRLLQGQTDTRLSERGYEQAQLLAKYLEKAHVNFTRAYSSDLWRALETCGIVTRKQLPILFTDLLRERSCGKFEGQPIDQARDFQQAYKRRTRVLAAGSASSASTASTAAVVTTTTAPQGPEEAMASPSTVSTVRVGALPGTPPTSSGGDSFVTSTTSSSINHKCIHIPRAFPLNPHFPAETSEDVQRRVRFFCEYVLFPSTRHREHILVVTHSGPIREIMKLFNNAWGAQITNPDILTPNTALNNFDILLSKKDSSPIKILPIQLHALPHLTFDVYNRDNPHPKIDMRITPTHLFNVPGASSHKRPSAGATSWDACESSDEQTEKKTGLLSQHLAAMKLCR